MKRLLLFVMIFLFVSAGIANAAFISGSTGASGAFDPTVNTMLQLPPDGIFNFTTINIRSGITVTFQKNAANTPVYMLATGDVNISGNIAVDGGSVSYFSAVSGAGGPGGFAGGSGGGKDMSGGKGLGPGGGGGGKSNSGIGYAELAGGGGYGTAGKRANTNAGACGVVYGNTRIIPMMGGSGGGGTAWFSNGSQGGGGGGGALLIASSGQIIVNGSITANGGTPGHDWGGGGSGGAIKLMANAISGGGTILARGGGNASGGGAGRIRLETYTNSHNGISDPPYTYDLPSSVFVANSPVLNITSIAGLAVPANPTGSYAQPDILLPNTTTNPVSVAVAASNIPVGTTVTITATPISGPTGTATAILAGTSASSTATANVNFSTLYQYCPVVT